MRKLIVQEFVTLDNFAAGLNNELDFMPQHSSGDAEDSVEYNQRQFIETIDTMILGRNTYQLFVEYWPTSTEHIAQALNKLKKVVCSTTLSTAPWGDFEPGIVISKEIEKTIFKLKEQPGKDIVLWGSIDLVHNLCTSALIDEYQLIISPVLIGRGKRLFPEDLKLKLKYKESKSFDDGFILVKYGRDDSSSK